MPSLDRPYFVNADLLPSKWLLFHLFWIMSKNYSTKNFTLQNERVKLFCILDNNPLWLWSNLFGQWFIHFISSSAHRQDFVQAYVDYVFNRSVAPLFESFHAGFHKVCGGKVLELFQPNELQAMVIGNTNYDWKELERVSNTTITFFLDILKYNWLFFF